MEISSTALSSLAEKTDAQSKTVAEGYDQFLTLLTTQLQYQDPLDPLDSTEFTNQLVQFSQVEQQITLNQKIDAMLQLQNTSLISSSLQYIGKGIYFQGDNMYWGEDTDSIRIGYTMDDLPASAKLRIVDSDGVSIRTADLPANTSTSNYVWDGKDDYGNTVEPGLYTVEIDALNVDDEAVTAFTGVPANVKGVETIDGAVYLTLDGDRQIAATQILSVGEQNNPATTVTEDNNSEDNNDA